jgi:hypothetical protein
MAQITHVHENRQGHGQLDMEINIVPVGLHVFVRDHVNVLVHSVFMFMSVCEFAMLISTDNFQIVTTWADTTVDKKLRALKASIFILKNKKICVHPLKWPGKYILFYIYYDFCIFFCTSATPQRPAEWYCAISGGISPRNDKFAVGVEKGRIEPGTAALQQGVLPLNNLSSRFLGMDAIFKFRDQQIMNFQWTMEIVPNFVGEEIIFYLHVLIKQRHWTYSIYVVHICTYIS